MSTRSNDIDQLICDLVSERLRESPELRQQFRAERRARRPSIWKLILDVIAVLTCAPITVGSPIFFSLIGFVQLGFDSVLGIHSLLSLIAAYALTLGIRSQLKRSNTLTIFSHLPTSDRDIARRVVWEWMLISLVLVHVNLCFYGVLAWNNPQFLGWLEVLLLTVGQWSVCLVTAIILTTWIHERLLKISLVLLIMALVAFCWLDLIIQNDANSFLFLLLPTGWLNGILSLGIVRGQLFMFWTLVPVAIWWLCGLWSKSVLAATYRIDEFTLRQGSPAEATARVTNSLATNPAAKSISWSTHLAQELIAEDEPLRSTSDLVEVVRSGDFLTKQDWSKLGWIERLIDQWLSPRERVLIEFITSEQIQWTKYWSAFLTQIPLFLFYCWMMGDFRAMIGYSIMIAPFVVAIGPWPAFRSRPCGGLYLAQLATFPCGFDEIRHVLLKVAVGRCLATLAYLLIPCAIITTNFPFWPLEGIVMALGCCVLMMFVAAWHVMGLFSLGVGFPNLRWRYALCCLVWGVLLFGTVLSMPLIGVALKQRGPNDIYVIAIGVGILIFCTTAGWFLLRKLYISGAIDLVRSRPSVWDQQLEQYETTHLKGLRFTAIQKKHGWFWWLKRELLETESA